MQKPTLLVGTVVAVMALLSGAPSPLCAQRSAPAVKPIDARSLPSLITDRNDRGLVLNVWATWCLPCVEEFPELVRLDSLYRARGVDVVTISIDYEDEVDTKVRPFLKRMRATMPAYVNAFGTPSDLINALEPSWSGGIPATFVYDRRGNRVEYVVGHQSLEAFRRLAERALRSTPPPSKSR
ncbi:MAG: TlpA family protein disulfide reductase [Bacteroidetes bacterium]|jgi:thiol-disulfide isomerase/thioredoxin|nr:TlpA family protein disulfide reductase [Bacteroidota bacterium]